jgi:uncharacterized protein YndB with AHSA1/START domain
MNEAREPGTLHHQGTRHSLRFERRLPHPPEKVWRALTENAELAHWFPARIDGARKPGAKLQFVFPGQQAEPGAAMEGELIVYDPPRTLEYSWGGEILRFELEPRDDHTLLRFTHAFDDEAKAARDASGWDFCLRSLEIALSGGPPEPFTEERLDALFEEYALRFGPKASSKRAPDA